MIEVEVKARVTDFKEVIKGLKKIGAEKKGSEHQEDVYYNAPHRDFAQTDEALRIRQISPEHGKPKILFTYKGAKMDKVSKTRKELEFKISDPYKMGLILEELGFNPVETIKKDRDIYTWKDYTITLDQVYRVGNFVEIEKEGREGDDFSQALEDIFDIYQKLGIKSGFVRESYLELLGV